jgi:hypothetical protein
MHLLIESFDLGGFGANMSCSRWMMSHHHGVADHSIPVPMSSSLEEAKGMFSMSWSMIVARWRLCLGEALSHKVWRNEVGLGFKFNPIHGIAYFHLLSNAGLSEV